jgi:hypothetical protein
VSKEIYFNLNSKVEIMNSNTRCGTFWAENPLILAYGWREFFPFSESARRCTSTALNSFTRFGLYLGVLLALLYRTSAYLGIALGFAVIAVAAYYGMKSHGKLREGFTSTNDVYPSNEQKTIVAPTFVSTHGQPDIGLVGGIDAADKPIADVIGAGDRTQPTAANPFMNILVNEVLDNPTKPPAANVDNNAMARQLSDEFQTRMYGDPTDVYQHTQDQRIWAVQPISSIPNDQGSFANWLYRVPGRTCKEGNNAACRSGVEGGVVTWLSAP